MGMAGRRRRTCARPVRALEVLRHDLTTERHEPDEPRGSRPDLWGRAGEIPARYPAAINEGAPVAAGRAGWLTWVQIGLNFVVPFLVSSYGYLAAAQVPRPPPPRQSPA